MPRLRGLLRALAWIMVPSLFLGVHGAAGEPSKPLAASFVLTAGEGAESAKEAVARAIGVSLLAFDVSVPERLENVIGSVAKARPDAFVVAGDPLFSDTCQRLVDVVARHRLPTMWETRGMVEAGGLMAYGADPAELYRRAATYADRILKGIKPADLPVEQPTKFALVINMKTAKSLRLTIAQPLLLRADQVID